MSIIGLQRLVFGVEDLPRARKFVEDFGLLKHEDERYTTQNGGEIILKPKDDTSLPPAFEEGSTLREVVWAVDNQASLEALTKTLKVTTGFAIDDQGVRCQDPNGMTHRFQLSILKTVQHQPTPLNQWGDYQRIDQASPVYTQAEPINIGHVVFFCEDLSAMEAFFTRTLGFHVSDRYTDRGVFMRAQATAGHHNVFILTLPQRKKGLNHVAFTVRDIHEVFGGGLAMETKAWSTFIGPGRHPISSAYFWYIKSPCGGAFEYYSNEDSLTERWKPREMTHSTEHFTEWAVEGGINPVTRRQHRGVLL